MCLRLYNQVVSECYGCATGITLPPGTFAGEIFQCPACGLELEVRFVDDKLGEVRHGPIITSVYEGIKRQLTLAQAPTEGEDFGE